MIEAFLRTLRRTYLPVGDFEQIKWAVAAGQLQINFLIGRIVLLRDGEVDSAIEDRLEPLTQELCLHGSRQLLADQNYSFKTWDYPGVVSLRIVADRVIVDGSALKTAELPREAFTESLLACAARVMRLMRQLHADYPDYDLSAYPYLEGVMAECSRLFHRRYGRDPQCNM